VASRAPIPKRVPAPPSGKTFKPYEPTSPKYEPAPKPSPAPNFSPPEQGIPVKKRRGRRITNLGIVTGFNRDNNPV
jgi:hypothetical protein